MKYFTPELLEQLNHANPKRIAAAHARWEEQVVRYRTFLDSIKKYLSASAREFAGKSSFHDAELLNLSYQDEDRLALVLLHNSVPYVAVFDLVGSPTLKRPNGILNFTSATMSWLYEEFDFEAGASVLRILWSDGTELTIPFSDVTVQSFDRTVLPVAQKTTGAVKFPVIVLKNRTARPTNRKKTKCPRKLRTL